MARMKNEHAVALGRLGGSVSSPRKTAAVTLNARRSAEVRSANARLKRSLAKPTPKAQKQAENSEVDPA